jgi:Fur family peroxide stress response transcriptional regulator
VAKGKGRETLRKKGFKATPQRLIIADVLRGLGKHLSSEQVFRRVRKRLPGISRATVYNTLHTLAECGMVRELKADSGKAIYDGNPEPHHHFVCERTGKIYDVPSEWVKTLDYRAVKKCFDVSNYTIIFRGKIKRINQPKGV